MLQGNSTTAGIIVILRLWILVCFSRQGHVGLGFRERCNSMKGFLQGPRKMYHIAASRRGVLESGVIIPQWGFEWIFE